MNEELIRRIVREELDKRETEKNSSISAAHNFRLIPLSKNIIYQDDGSMVIDMNNAI